MFQYRKSPLWNYNPVKIRQKKKSDWNRQITIILSFKGSLKSGITFFFPISFTLIAPFLLNFLSMWDNLTILVTPFFLSFKALEDGAFFSRTARKMPWMISRSRAHHFRFFLHWHSGLASVDGTFEYEQENERIGLIEIEATGRIRGNSQRHIMSKRFPSLRLDLWWCSEKKTTWMFTFSTETKRKRNFMQTLRDLGNKETAPRRPSTSMEWRVVKGPNERPL